ncbi:MAG: flagellar biosynthesis protein FlhB [Clostridia bacterium]|nr:flagellar biosynthesis protein FlhB [Clostridia bacterium]
MMAMDDKTEKATPKRRKEAREKGQVFKSADLSAAILLLSMFGILKVAGGTFVYNVEKLYLKYFSMAGTATEPLNTDDLASIFLSAAVIFFIIIVPILGASLLVSLITNYLQVGFLNVKDPLTPKWEKINPIQGLKRIFSMRSVIEMVKSIIKFTVMAYILYKEIRKTFSSFPSLISSELVVSLKFVVDFTMKVAFKLGLALLIIGVIDYFYQWWEYERSLMMTKQEVKDEFKQTEGDPYIKGKLKQKRTQMSMMRMMSEVAKADVVITNPTHYAIAIVYDETIGSAPIVLAKGKDFVAQKIKEKAKELKIEIVENKPLAQALYATVEIGEEIPSEFYAAVAEILVKIYNIKNK